MEKEIKDLRKEALRTAWNMRGGLTYDQALDLSIEERKIVDTIIKENVEITKKTKLPYF
jgi:hypothetical protein